MASSKVHSTKQNNSADLSESEREFILQGIRDNCRTDGRELASFRRRQVEVGVFPLSHGSARILKSCWCSVKAELVRPTCESPDWGIVGVEVDQKRWGFMEDACTAAMGETLCLVAGVAAWKLHVDVTSNGESNMTAIAECIRYALADTILPSITVLAEESSLKKTVLDRIHLEDDDGHSIVQSVNDLPHLVTIHVMDNAFGVLDATFEEDLVADCVVYVVIGPGKDAMGVSTTGLLPLSMVDNCIPLAIQAVPGLEDAYKVVKTRCLLQPAVRLE